MKNENSMEIINLYNLSEINSLDQTAAGSRKASINSLQ
jgi:hypothetical protein